LERQPSRPDARNDDSQRGRVHATFLVTCAATGFQRIRQFGLLANRRRDELVRCRQLLGTTGQTTESVSQDYQALYQTVTGTALQQCPACRTGTMKFFSFLLALTNYGVPHTQHAAAVVSRPLDSS